MRTLAALVVLLLAGCATTPPQPAPFERCMQAIGPHQYGSDRLAAARWCHDNNNGDIQ